MKLKLIKSQPKFPYIILDRMTEMKLITGVIVSQWLDLSSTDSWIRCSDMYIRFANVQSQFQIAMNDTNVSDALFEFVVQKIRSYMLPESDEHSSTAFETVRAAQIDLPDKHESELYKLAKWNITRHQIQTLSDATRHIMTDHQKELFSSIKRQITGK